MRFNVAAVLVVVAGSLGSLALTGCAGSAEPPADEEATEASSDALVWGVCHPGSPCSRCGNRDTYYWADGDKGGWFCGAAVIAPVGGSGKQVSNVPEPVSGVPSKAK